MLFCGLFVGEPVWMSTTCTTCTELIHLKHHVRNLTGGSFPRKIHDMRKLDQLDSGATKFHDGPDTIRHFQFSGDL